MRVGFDMIHVTLMTLSKNRSSTKTEPFLTLSTLMRLTRNAVSKHMTHGIALRHVNITRLSNNTIVTSIGNDINVCFNVAKTKGLHEIRH
jgi:hypothetical protein